MTSTAPETGAAAAPPVAEPPVIDPPWEGYTPAHEELRTRVREWVRVHVAPHVDAWERAGDFPRELFAAAGEAGLFGHKVPVAFGGQGVDFTADLVVTEELTGCWSGGVAAALGAHKDLGSYYIWRFGTPAQRERWVPPALRGSSVTALAVTEPGAGSDVAGVRTSAARAADGWVLDGAKTFITNGSWADVVVVAALSDPEAGGHHGLSLFVVEAGDPGFSRRRVPTLGWRTSHTGELAFAGVELADDRLLGGPEQAGQGFPAIMRNFQWERIVLAVAAVRQADDVLDLARRHARGEGAHARLADLAAETEAARSLARHAVRLHHAGRDAVREVSMAKWLACDLAVRVCEAAVEAAGWDGGLAQHRLERALRDARLGPIGGGTSEIMLEVVGRSYGL